MKLAIAGSSGYLGEYLTGRFSRIKEMGTPVKLGRRENADYLLDLAKTEEFNYSVLESIDYMVFAAAISGPDKCANEYRESWKINVEGTCHVIERAIEMGCKVLFLSSDAVYGNRAGYIYSEESLTEAETPYGEMKKTVEDAFKGDPFFKALRLSYVVSVKDKFVSYCLKCMEENREAEVFHPFYRNCITLDDVGSMVVWLINNWDKFPHPFLNAAGEELVSRVRIADEINRVADGRLKFRIVHPDKNFFRNRPPFTQMVSLYIDSYNILERISFTSKFQRELEGYLNG